MSMAQDTSVGSTSSNSSNNNIERRAEIMQGPLRKGPWTAEEDKILREYVNKHGEGNWHVVERVSGLRRCGKSCRLRWANQLKPNLKKGPMSVEEEAIIVNLHHKLGNKWARIASKLPGRTDNEIKNFWNTRYKKCQRDNLRVYEVISRDQKTPNHQQQPATYNPLLFSSPSPSTMPMLQHPGNPTRTSIYDAFPSRNTNSLHGLPNSCSFISNVTGSLNGLNDRPYGKEIINHHSPSLFSMPYNYPFQYYGQNGEASGTTRRFPSVQTFVPIIDGFTAPRDGNTGLLEDVVRGYLNNMQQRNEDIRIHENDAVPEQSFTSFLDRVLVEPTYGDEPNPAHRSTGTNVMTNTLAPMDPCPVYDDELSHLLVNFASVAPTSDWFDRGETVEENCNQNLVKD